MLALCPLFHGCLVETYEFPEEMISTVTLRSARDSQRPIEFPEIGQIVELGDDLQGSITFRVFVGTQNVDQDLIARWRIVTGEDGAQSSLQSMCDPEEGEPVVPGDGNLERGFQFSIPRSTFGEDGCYAIELAVSPEFTVSCSDVINEAPGLFDSPRVPNTAAVARWYVIVGEAPNGCPRQMLAEPTP